MQSQRRHEVYLEETVINSIKDAFEGENIQTQYSPLGYRIDLYFCKRKLGIEIDELGHADRNFSSETEKQKVLENELDWVFIRINPDEKILTFLKKQTRYTDTLKYQLKSHWLMIFQKDC